MRLLLFAIGTLPLFGQHIPIRLPAGEAPAVKQVNEALRVMRNPARPPVNACFPDALANAYAREAMAANPAAGVTEARIRSSANNTVSLFVQVDVAAASRFRPRWSRHIPSPFLTGRKTVEVSLRFRAEDGHARAEVEKALLNGVRVPAALIQLGLRFAARFRGGQYNVFEGAALPFGVRNVFTRAGEVCVQR